MDISQGGFRLREPRRHKSSRDDEHSVGLLSKDFIVRRKISVPSEKNQYPSSYQYFIGLLES
jgi:hypothetical protein